MESFSLSSPTSRYKCFFLLLLLEKPTFCSHKFVSVSHCHTIRKSHLYLMCAYLFFSACFRFMCLFHVTLGKQPVFNVKKPVRNGIRESVLHASREWNKYTTEFNKQCKFPFGKYVCRAYVSWYNLPFRTLLGFCVFNFAGTWLRLLSAKGPLWPIVFMT